MIKSQEKACPGDVFGEWQNWCNWGNSPVPLLCEPMSLGVMKHNMRQQYMVKTQNLKNLLNQYTPLFKTLCNVIVDFCVSKRQKLTEMLSSDSFVKMKVLMNDWDIPSIDMDRILMVNSRHVLLHYDMNENGDRMIDNILLISGGRIITNNSFILSRINPLCLDIKFKLFTVTDEVLIVFDPNASSEYGQDHKCCCHIIPDREAIYVNDNMIPNVKRIKEICYNKAEHHITITRYFDNITMEYIDDLNKTILYKITETTILPLNFDRSRVSIENGTSKDSFMLITHLELYCKPND